MFFSIIIFCILFFHQKIKSSEIIFTQVHLRTLSYRKAKVKGTQQIKYPTLQVSDALLLEKAAYKHA